MANISRLPFPIWEHWEWQLHGACRDGDPEIFFSPDSERGARRRAREAVAKAYCARCPVLEQCRTHALAVREPYGVWGGLNTAERELLVTGSAGVPMESLAGEPARDLLTGASEVDSDQAQKVRSTTALDRRVARR